MIFKMYLYKHVIYHIYTSRPRLFVLGDFGVQSCGKQAVNMMWPKQAALKQCRKQGIVIHWATGLLESISPESIETIGKHSVMYSWTSWTIGITKRRWNQVPRPSVKLHSPEGAPAVGRCWRKTKLPLLEVGKLGIVWQNLRCTSPMLHGCSTCLVTWNPI